MTRVERVRQALADSGDQAADMIARRLAGLDLSAITHILLDTCKDIALCYGASVAGGAALGGIGGAFLGGVGAVPGAAAGAALGFQAGNWILALLGFKSLAEGLAKAIPGALRYYERGFVEAWGPTPHEHHRNPAGICLSGGNPRHAAWEFANGHVLMITALLSVVVACLTRGRGERAVMLREVRESPRLGPKVAEWIEQNKDKLRSMPALQQRRSAALESAEEAPPKPPRRHGEGSPEEPEPRAPRGMPRKKVPCFEPNGLPQARIPEFDRQLAGQEKGINDMTVDEYLRGRQAFEAKESVRDPKVAREARIRYEKDLRDQFVEQFKLEGLSQKMAEVKANEMAGEKMKILAALHNPDMIAGGKDVISDFGDRNVNSRIGPQWKSRVGELDKAASSVPESVRADIKMNAKLERCK